MAKAVHIDVLDQALNYIKNNGDRLCICSDQPTTVDQALNQAYDTPAGYNIATKTISGTDYTGPGTGDTSGRKVAVNAATGLTAVDTKNATHVAIVKNVATTALLYVTTCTSQSCTSGNTVNTPAWDIEIRDPT